MTSSDTSHSGRELARGTVLVSGLTGISRALGFIRDLVVASTFGASLVTDAFFVAFRIPNLLRSFVAEGALTSAFVPVFSEELTKSLDAARTALRTITGLMIVITICLSVLGIVFAPDIVALFGAGFGDNPDQAALCVTLTRIMLPFVVFISLVAMFNGALNTLKVFGTGALAQIILNIVFILGALAAMLYEPSTGIVVLACAVLVGGIVQVFPQILLLSRHGLALGLPKQLWTSASKLVLKLMAPAVIGASVYQISIFMHTVLASLLPTGSVTWLFYADRITQLPLGVFSIALASVLLPALSTAAATSNHKQFNKNLVDSLRYTSFVILPVAAAIFILADDLVTALFERGAFGATDSQYTALAVQALCLGLWPTSCYSMIVRGFLARKDTITPTLIGVLTLGVGVSAGMVLMGPFDVVPESKWVASLRNLQLFLVALFGSGELAHVGLALASTLGALCSLIAGLLAFRFKFGAMDYSRFMVSTLQAFIGTLSLTAALLVCSQYLESSWATVLVAAAIGPVAFLLPLAALRNRETLEAFAAVRQVLKRKRSRSA